MTSSLYNINHGFIWAKYLSSLYNPNQKKSLINNVNWSKDEKKCIKYFVQDAKWIVFMFIMNTYYDKLPIKKNILHAQSGISISQIQRILKDCLAEKWLVKIEASKSWLPDKYQQKYDCVNQASVGFQATYILVDTWNKYINFRLKHVRKSAMFKSLAYELLSINKAGF